jgi:hypothetical protein
LTLNITRRQALHCAIAGAFAPSLMKAFDPFADSELVNVDDFTPKPYGEPHDWTPQQVCRVFAAWELGAQQNNQPHDWRSLQYDSAFQWNDGKDGRLPLIAFYGIGPADWTLERLQDLAAWLWDCEDLQGCAAEYGEHRVFGWARIARGRAFAIVSCGKLSRAARAAFRRDDIERERGYA